MRELVRLRLGRVEVGGQWIVLFAELLDGGAPRCCGWGACQLGGAAREPLDLLQLDAIPRRIADHRVEAAFWLIALPVLPHARERGLPVQEVLAVREGLGLVPERGKARPCRVAGIGQKVVHGASAPLAKSAYALACWRPSVVTSGPSRVARFFSLRPALIQRKPQRKSSRPRRSAVVSSTCPNRDADARTSATSASDMSSMRCMPLVAVSAPAMALAANRPPSRLNSSVASLTRMPTSESPQRRW